MRLLLGCRVCLRTDIVTSPMGDNARCISEVGPTCEAAEEGLDTEGAGICEGVFGLERCESNGV